MKFILLALCLTLTSWLTFLVLLISNQILTTISISQQFQWVSDFHWVIQLIMVHLRPMAQLFLWLVLTAIPDQIQPDQRLTISELPLQDLGHQLMISELLLQDLGHQLMISELLLQDLGHQLTILELLHDSGLLFIQKAGLLHSGLNGRHSIQVGLCPPGTQLENKLPRFSINFQIKSFD
jgi:hypothetical protein